MCAILWTAIHARVLQNLSVKYKSFDRSNLPESPQILDIYSVMVL